MAVFVKRKMGVFVHVQELYMRKNIISIGNIILTSLLGNYINVCDG